MSNYVLNCPQAKKLTKKANEVTKMTIKEYYMSDKEDVLSAESVSAHLSGAASKLKIEVHNVLDSTNRAVRELAINGEPEGKVIIALEQTAGRGRKNRAFFSPCETGIYMSVLLRPQMAATDAALITTAAAVATAQAIEKHTSKQAQIKWVNDIFVDGKKVCGILTEAGLSTETAMLDYAVLGIGVNVTSPKDGFPQELTDIATSLFEHGKIKNIRSVIAADILNIFMDYYGNLAEREYMDEYKKRLFILGEKITVFQGDSVRSSTALDINDDCHLLVQYDDGTKEYLVGGEIYRVCAGARPMLHRSFM